MAKAKKGRVVELSKAKRELKKHKEARRRAWQRILQARHGAKVARTIVSQAEEQAAKLPEFRQSLVKAEARVTGLELAFKRKFGDTRKAMDRDEKILRLQAKLAKAELELARLKGKAK